MKRKPGSDFRRRWTQMIADQENWPQINAKGANLWAGWGRHLAKKTASASMLSAFVSWWWIFSFLPQIDADDRRSGRDWPRINMKGAK